MIPCESRQGAYLIDSLAVAGESAHGESCVVTRVQRHILKHVLDPKYGECIPSPRH